MEKYKKEKDEDHDDRKLFKHNDTKDQFNKAKKSMIFADHIPKKPSSSRLY